MEAYVQYVKRTNDTKAFLLAAAFYAAAVLCFIGLYAAAGNIAFVPFPFFLIAAFLASKVVLNKAKVEYEYSVSAGILCVTAIENGQKRTQILNMNPGKIITFGYLNDLKETKEKGKTLKIDCSLGSEENRDSMIYFTCDYENRGEATVILEPDEQILKKLAANSKIAYNALAKTGRMV